MSDQTRVRRETPGRIEIGHQGLSTVQALRAASCLLVVAYHAVESWGAGLRPSRAADALWPNGAAGVDVFFVISGFVMALSSERLTGRAGAARFVRHRLRRVVPLYWVLSAANLAGRLATAGPAPTAWHVAASFLFVPSRDAAGVVRPLLGVGWTLQFEMLFYALFAAALLFRRPGLRTMLPLLVPLAAAGFFRRPDWPAPLVLANGLVLEFCLGLGVAAWLGRRGVLPPGLAACALTVGVVSLLALPQPGIWRFVVWGLPAALLLIGAVSLEQPLGHRVPGWLLSVGEASYAIYLVHPFVVPLLSRVAGRLPAGSGLPVLAAASLAASTLAGMALHRWVDRPIQARLSARRPHLPRGRTEPVPHLVQP